MALRSRDGGGLLTLVGTLQQDGLAIGDLGWQLSPAVAEKSYEQAMGRAVDLLTERAGTVASLLHLTLHGFQTLTVGQDGGPPAPLGMMRMMAAPLAAAAPPSAQADVVTVSATVSGNARLVEAGP